MNRRIHAAALLLAVAALSACGTKRDPNMPTAEEDEQINNAAEMLDGGNEVGANEDVTVDNEDEVTDENADAEAADNGTGND